MRRWNEMDIAHLCRAMECAAVKRHDKIDVIIIEKEEGDE